MRSVLKIKYAILGLRRLLWSIKNQCVKSSQRKASTVQPIMSDLPVERLGYKQPPFNHTAVDYFRPLYFPVRRSTEKRWGFFFTCLATRAEHLEIVPYLDTNSCVKGNERFIARRGTPSRSGRITARILLVWKRNCLPAARIGTAWLQPFLHTNMLLGNLTRQAHLIMAAPGSASSEASSACFMIY